MKKVNDSFLVSKIKKGNKNAFKEIYDRYHEQLYFLAKSYLKNPYLAEDAVQDIFLKLWKKRRTLDSSSSIKGFLFAMIKNHLVDMLRKRTNSRKIKEGYKILSEDKHLRNTTGEKIIFTEYEEIIKKAVNNLSPAQKKVFEMRCFEGFSNAEVAEKNKVSIHTVKTQFYLGSKYVRNYLKKQAGF